MQDLNEPEDHSFYYIEVIDLVSSLIPEEYLDDKTKHLMSKIKKQFLCFNENLFYDMPKDVHKYFIDTLSKIRFAILHYNEIHKKLVYREKIIGFNDALNTIDISLEEYFSWRGKNNLGDYEDLLLFICDDLMKSYIRN